jgi:hypothetical protein
MPLYAAVCLDWKNKFQKKSTSKIMPALLPITRNWEIQCEEIYKKKKSNIHARIWVMEIYKETSE